MSRALDREAEPADPADGFATERPVLVAIPTYCEVGHIGAVLAFLGEDTRTLSPKVRIIVADGGSPDGTRATVEDHARNDDRVELLHNERRIQSSAINRAVERQGEEDGLLIRIDAHASYPPGFCRALVEDLLETGADSVVVSMVSSGTGPVQRAAAAAQNSVLGNGGSAHRSLSEGRFVEHGHHALMRIDAFRAVGGYDESFRHNEDAELDQRLTGAGHRLWLSGRTSMRYFPRSSLSSLLRQYFAYGRGRASTLLKHRLWPRPRQLVLVGIAPAVILMPLIWILAVPVAVWIAATLVYGLVLAIRARDAAVLLAGPAALVMHFAWSAGFCWRLVRQVAGSAR